jgi:hypothetical protein
MLLAAVSGLRKVNNTRCPSASNWGEDATSVEPRDPRADHRKGRAARTLVAKRRGLDTVHVPLATDRRAKWPPSLPEPGALPEVSTMRDRSARQRVTKPQPRTWTGSATELASATRRHEFEKAVVRSSNRYSTVSTTSNDWNNRRREAIEPRSALFAEYTGRSSGQPA